MKLIDKTEIPINEENWYEDFELLFGYRIILMEVTRSTSLFPLYYKVLYNGATSTVVTWQPKTQRSEANEGS